jgi:hypothetical protein
MNQRTLKTKLVPALALAFLIVVPMFLATLPFVKASKGTTPVLSVVFSGTTSTTLIPAQSVGSTFSIDIRVDNTSSVSPGINSYSYGLIWNPAVLNVTNVNDAFSGSFLNSGANQGTVESLGDLPANNTEGLLVIGDIILNTSDFAACATGSGVLTTVTFDVKAAGQSNINLQPSDAGVAYLTFPDSQGNSHDVAATTINAAYVSLTPSSTVVEITGYKLIFNTTLSNMFESAQNINYSWRYEVYTYNTTTDLPIALISSSATPVTEYSAPTGISIIYNGERDAVLPSASVNWGSHIEVVWSFAYTLDGPTYTVGGTTILSVHPGDINGDGVVNGKDLHILATLWLETVPPETNPTSNLARADINGDGVVNGKDLHILASSWLLSYSI